METRPGGWLSALIAVALVATGIAAADEAARSVVDGREVLASVNGEPVTAEDLRWQIGTLHESMPDVVGLVARPDPVALLQRVINAKLIVQEARNIGLDETPEVRSMLEAGRQELLKRFLIDERIKEIHEGDPAAVEDLYEQMVQEVQVRSVLFRSREDATAFETAVRGGASFEQVLAPLVESGKADTKGAEYLKVSEMRPGVAAAVVELEPGSITSPIDVPGGVAVIRLLGFRVPEDPDARAAAEETALTYRRQAALLDYTEEMRQRYVKVDKEVRDSLDFDSGKVDVEAYRGDGRILAEVKGAEPVTVGELTSRVEQTFYHGLDRAAERNRINDKLPGVLDRIVLERAMELEAKRLGIEDRPAFSSARKAQEESILFGTFVRRVVNPEIQLSDEKLQAIYREHLDDYSTPAMIRLRSLPFEDREHAEAGLEKLRRGSDLEWMRANAGGLVDEPDRIEELLEFDGRLLTLSSLPDRVQDAVAGASAGQFRLYAQPDGPFYVLAVVELLPSRPREFADVRDQLLQRAFLLEREKAMDVWTDELRKASEIEVHADEARLAAIVGLSPAEGE
jgi:parvulin-like peptidyl-prolyl isomerase